MPGSLEGTIGINLYFAANPVSGFPYHPKTNEHNIQIFFLCPNLFFPTIKCFLNSKTSYRNGLNSNNKLSRSHAPEDRDLIEHRWKDESVGDRE